MRMKTLSFAAALAAALAWRAAPAPRAQSAPLPAPTFHHLHLNSMNPNTAIDWYTKAFPATSKTTWAGEPALKSPNNVLILFTKVDQPPATQPQTAFWHFGWHVRQERTTTEANCEEPRGTQKTWPALEVDGMYRAPSVAIAFGDVSMGGYMRQGDRPLVDTRGHVVDHVGLGVADLNAWFAKLRGESVKILEPTHKIGESRAFMIEGPSKEAIEIIEVK